MIHLRRKQIPVVGGEAQLGAGAVSGLLEFPAQGDRSHVPDLDGLLGPVL